MATISVNIVFPTIKNEDICENQEIQLKMEGLEKQIQEYMKSFKSKYPFHITVY